MSIASGLNELFKAVFAKGNMRGFITLWALALFTYAFVFMEKEGDEQYKVLLISIVSLAIGVYIGKQMKDDE